ncbi:MAG: tetratricopeptide repeat protein, partial [Sulfurifustis sp.]
KKDFASALRYFEQAKTAGLDTPAVCYNLGATLYNLGRYEEAENTFRDCSRDPAWAALAYYNAGLAAYRRGRYTTAADYFDRSARLADSDEVLGLARAMLARTNPAALRRAAGSFALNFGYNDNVTLAANGQTLQASNQSDQFAELFASTSGLWGEGSHARRWEASIYDLTYAHLKSNSITQLSLGAAQPLAFAQWHTDVAIQWEYVLRDRQRFQQIASARVDSRRDWASHRDVHVSVEISAINALDPNFEFLDGSRRRLTASTTQPLGIGWARIGATLERNDRDDLSTTPEFFSFSPKRASVWLKGSWPLGAYWQLEPTLRYTQSHYADPDRRASGVVARREDDERQMVLRVKYRVSAAWRAVAEYSFVDNRSNVPEFSYLQRVASVGFARPF